MNKRFLIVVVTLLAMVFSFSALAEEELPTQKWDASEWTLVGNFEMEGMNFTPLKEIATDEYNWVEVRVDSFQTETPVYFLLGVIYYQSDFLPVSKLIPLGTSGENIIIRCPVEEGTIFQVLTQVYTERGEYDKDLPCTLGYSYRLVNED